MSPSGLDWVRSFEGLPDAFDIAWSADGRFLAATGRDGEVAIWPATGRRPRNLKDRKDIGDIHALAWHPTLPKLATASNRGIVRIWDVTAGTSRATRVPGSSFLTGIAWSPDGQRLAILSSTGSIGVWDVQQYVCLQESTLQSSNSWGLSWSPDQQELIVAGGRNVYILAADDLRLIRTLSGHTESVVDVALSSDGSLVAAASGDATVRVWDRHEGTDVAVLEGHTSEVRAVQFAPHGDFLASASLSHQSSRATSTTGEVRLWRCRDWELVAVVPRQVFDGYGGLAFHPSEPLLAAMEVKSRSIDCYQIDYARLDGTSVVSASRRYGNAKVVLIGDTGVGKSALGLVLSGQRYEPTDSTHGRHVWTVDATEVKVPGGTQTREVLLWDLAGQPSYRIIHQLHLNEVAVALIVFDSRSETDPFVGVRYWARALAQARRLEGASALPMKAYLVAARADRGGVGVSRERVRSMVEDLGLDGFFETSAKEGWQVVDLSKAIRGGIDWDALPMISSSILFDSIKQFLLEEKQLGRLLSTVDDLFRSFRHARPDDADDGRLLASFETCIGRVESRGLIRRLRFGNLVLLQPELLDAYASGMVQAAKSEPDGLGFISEEEALAGQFGLAESERVSDRGQEKLLLIATVEELLRHEIALKETTERGVDLVFPSQFTRERPDAPDIPGKEVIFAFEGPLHTIYATLAVRLSHSTLFRRQAMWQNAASYTATVGGVCGIHLHELEEGRGELVLFYDNQASRSVRSQFETYVAGHLRSRASAGTLTRRAIRVCAACGYVLPEELVRRRLDRGAATIRCPACEETDISLTETPVAPVDVAVAEMNRSADERRDQNAAALRLRGKMETGDYDVFLCHNSRDKKQVMAIGERLKEHGILPWLDTWEIPPGARWQKELQKQLKSVRSAAIFIGAKGPGPWQEIEVEALLGEIARRNRPLIPVILDSRTGNPRLPTFLKMWHVIDMRQPDPDPFEQLVWGITGEKSAKFLTVGRPQARETAASGGRSARTGRTT